MERLRYSARLLLATFLFYQLCETAAQVIRPDSEAPPPVELLLRNNSCVMSNGILNVTLSIPSGMVTNISYNGSFNLLDEQIEEGNRGYWNIFRIPNKTEDRFVMLRGSSGFYTYTVLERLAGWPNMQIVVARIVFKLQPNMSYYMAMSDVRQRIMPTSMDRKNGVVLDYKEAVHLFNTSNPDFIGEVDDKYLYSDKNIEKKVYGWISLSETPVGFWMITPTNEFRNGGPFKQDLTSHVGPTILNVFQSIHYAGKDLSMNFNDKKPWKKVLGPVFIYLNSNPNNHSNITTLWEDAKNKMIEETAKWPYEFPNSTDFVKSNQRGVLRGSLFVLDRYVNNVPEAAAFAYVGLAKPGTIGSWQRESKGYQFWTKADFNGNFIIKNIIPGNYSLYASVPGSIGDYKYESDIVINPGSDSNVNNLVYEPPRNGPTLWEIGIPDRTAAEFFIPNPEPIFKVHKYIKVQDRFREYGLWRCYTDLYPNNDLIYTVGFSNFTTDWFFAHVTRLARNNTYVATTWQIVFDLPTIINNKNYTLQLALAAAKAAELQVRLNDEHTVNPHFSTGLIGDDNSVARHGINGLYWFYSIEFSSNLLIKGRNVIYLTQARGSNKFFSVMYDYIRFEEPI